MTFAASNPLTVSQVLQLVGPELRRATSDLDLKARLARIGYAFRDTRRGRILMTAPHGIEIAPISTAYRDTDQVP